ncbi:hypothetical protein B0I35DRAFT_358261 [Stachybotrys elegans]|uniref:Uncharacterized protein n=1 Tax=Stachybotrys elegans TaxID=80388 RepID=A0A8K0WM50_9HYPO|nr:hypothetical protein B0I35DRAFT_358261 [Stachybotrys elegans]
MKTVAAKRKEGQAVKHNLLQLPPDLLDKSSSSDPKDEGPDSKEGRKRRQAEIAPRRRWASQGVAMPMPVSGLELIVRESGIHLLDLSALTTIHIGAVASLRLSADPSLLSRLLSCRQDSYMEFVYSRYGFWRCLDQALLSLILRVQQLLMPQKAKPAAVVWATYSRALSSLQDALKDKDTWSAPEVLCAAEILARFELLGKGVSGWMPHIWGAARLLRLRGPNQYLSDFEKTLFTTLSGPIICESFLTNKGCFLGEEIWSNLRLSMAKEDGTLSSMCRIGIGLAMEISKTPGIGRQITDMICSDEPIDESQLAIVLAETRECRSGLLTWKAELYSALTLKKKLTTAELLIDRRYEHVGTALAGSISMARLLGCISPHERALLEEEAILCSHELLDLVSRISLLNYSAGFYLEQKSIFARGVLNTTDIWEPSLRSGKLIERWKFERWCDAMGRMTTDYSRGL